jgi:3-oxoadipate enol-lactonase
MRTDAFRTIEFLKAQPPTEEVREQILSYNLAFTPQAKLAWPTVIAYEDISADVGKIAVPTLVLPGDQVYSDK